MDSLDTEKTAVVRANAVSNMNQFTFQLDSSAVISLTDYKPNHLTYRSANPNTGVVVFSEMYYPNGWNAYIDGKLTEHFKVNYVLRALKLSAGDHTIEFKFEPEVVKTGSKIALASSVLLGLIVVGSTVFSVWRLRRKEKETT